MKRAPEVKRLRAFDALGVRTRVFVGVALGATLLSFVLSALGRSPLLLFVVSGGALAVLAALVGDATEQLGSRLGPGATGVLQSALGNLPELFVSIFALRAGLLQVVQAALVGSILGNGLLVLGLAFLVGGLRHGTQTFAGQAPRTIATLTLLAVAALAIPTLGQALHGPVASHENALSVASAIVLLVVFVGSIPVSLQGGPTSVPTESPEELGERWPLWLAVVLLVFAGAGAALVSDWFVSALTPAMSALNLSQSFTGLVIVALAGNAVENVVGIQLAAKNKMDYAVSVILNSSLQVALGLFPVLVLLSLLLGHPLTLVLPPLLVAGLGLAALLGTVITYDGESTWLEGLALVGLYAILAVSFWWG